MKSIKIKLLFLIFILITTSNYLFPQEMTFSETVDYIKSKMINTYAFKSFEAEEYGNVKITRHYPGLMYNNIHTFNLNDIDEIVYDSGREYYWVKLKCSTNNSCIKIVSENGKYTQYDESEWIGAYSEKDAKSLVKAFIYLKSILKKDPFKP